MCGKQTLVKRQRDLATVFPLRCRSWSCPTCAPRRRKQLIRIAKTGSPTRFITLTVNPEWGEGAEHRGQNLAKAWRDIVREYRRIYPGREAEYLVVLELTKRGEPHLHILWRGGFMPQKWLSGQMRQRIGAPVVDVRSVRGEKEVAQYVAKYISKRNIKLGSMKRYWRSSHYLAESETARKKRLNKDCRFTIIDLDIKHYKQFFSNWPGGLVSFDDETFGFAYGHWHTAPPFMAS